MSRCIECGQRGHYILACPQFYEELLKPSPGICARCHGEGTFQPYEIPARPGRPRQIEAILVCPCCSFEGCTHKPAAVVR